MSGIDGEAGELTRRHKVLFLIPNLRGGGAERVITLLLTHLDRSRLRLALGVVDMRGAVFQGDVPADVECIDLGCTRVRYALPKILRLAWSMRPQVVFSTLGHLNLALAMVRPLFASGVRLIGRETTMVSHVLAGYSWPRPWAWGYRRFYPRLDHVVCQCRDMRDDLVHNYAFPQERVTGVYNPIDIEGIRRLARASLRQQEGVSISEHEPVHLVAAGRLAAEKGFDMLIEAVALCRNAQLRVTVLGDGPLARELEILAEKHGVGGQFRFLGFQKNPYPFFARADAFVLSSRYEGFPNVVLEALACGTPVIATPAPGGTREILDAIPQCEVADAVSASALAAAIERWVARRPGRVGGEVTALYAVERIVRQYERLISDVAAL